MKSSWELALERTGGALAEISEEKKAKIADLEVKRKAKEAEADLAAQRRSEGEQDPAKLAQINEDLIAELASVRDRFERQKEAIRKE